MGMIMIVMEKPSTYCFIRNDYTDGHIKEKYQQHFELKIWSHPHLPCLSHLPSIPSVDNVVSILKPHIESHHLPLPSALSLQTKLISLQQPLFTCLVYFIELLNKSFKNTNQVKRILCSEMLQVTFNTNTDLKTIWPCLVSKCITSFSIIYYF